MNGGIDILRLIDDQRIVAAHLKSEYFFRLAGKLAMELKAGGRTAGKQQTVDI